MEKDPGRIQTHTNGQESRTRRRQEEEGPERTQATALRLPDLGGRDARVSGRPHGEGPRAVSGRRKALAHRSHEGAGRRVGPRQCRAEKKYTKIVRARRKKNIMLKCKYISLPKILLDQIILEHSILHS